MLKSESRNCPNCNPENGKNGVMLFFVEGDGRKFYFCGKCVCEFEISGDSLKQTKAIELDMTPVEEEIEIGPSQTTVPESKQPTEDILIDPEVIVDTSVSTVVM